MDFTAENVAAVLNAADLASRVWAKSGTTRVYVQIDRAATQAALGLTNSQARQVERQGGMYVEIHADEALVQGAPSGTVEQRIVGVLTAAGFAAR